MIFYNTDENKETVVDQKTIIQIIAHKGFRNVLKKTFYERFDNFGFIPFEQQKT